MISISPEESWKQSKFLNVDVKDTESTELITKDVESEQYVFVITTSYIPGFNKSLVAEVEPLDQM